MPSYRSNQQVHDGEEGDTAEHVFYAVALQCVSTLAVLAREAKSIKLPVQMFFGYGALAYGLAL
ncbi:MAG: hypothetical protein AAF184_06670 [Pseudomonadota bacterium]